MFRRAVFVLTFWYVLALAVLCAGFSITLYQSSTHQLDKVQRRQEQIIHLQSVLNPPPELVELDNERLQVIKDAKQEIATRLTWLVVGILTFGGGISYLLARRTLKPIEENMEFQTRFTADASHELRTPLTVLKTELEVALRDEELTLQESKQLHLSALEEVEKLQQLTGSLLALHQTPESVTLEEADTEQAIRTAVAETPVGTSHYTLHVSPLKAGIRFPDLVQVLKILLSNAVKYGPEGGGEISVTNTVKGHTVRITVQDHGSGVSPAEQHHIFKRFYRTNSARSKAGAGGYGLGLAIAKRLVEAHGATLEVQSEYGKGSVFTIILKNA